MWKLLDASAGEWIGFLAALAGIVFLLWLALRVRSWFRGGEDPAETEQQMLTQMGNLYRQGDLTDEEYRSIKSRLVERLDGALREAGPAAVAPPSSVPHAAAESGHSNENATS
jgi:hypothetical protein